MWSAATTRWHCKLRQRARSKRWGKAAKVRNRIGGGTGEALVVIDAEASENGIGLFEVDYLRLTPFDRSRPFAWVCDIEVDVMPPEARGAPPNSLQSVH